MNNATNHAFRSHMMQQFVAQARTQSRPPLALMGIISEDSSDGYNTATESGSTRNSSLRRHHSAPAAAVSAALPRRSVTQHHHHRGLRLQQQSLPTPMAPRYLSSAAAVNRQEDGENNEQDNDSIDFQPNLSLLFQDMLQSRRSSSRFLPYGIASSSSSSLLSSSVFPLLSGAAVDDDENDDDNTATKLLQQEQLYWKQVLERAVQCGCQAPNHKRTEPFTFKRMIAPSPATERLADIFYHVTLRKQQKQQNLLAVNGNNNQQPSAEATFANNINSVEEEMERTAQRKREKWSQIPAFLVTIVSSPSTTTNNNNDQVVPSNDQAAGAAAAADTAVNDDAMMDDEYLYEPLPYSAPHNERALEDYASACAATQNVLLSLHSEDVASKWVTGPVIQTRAFRNLVLGSGEHDSHHHLNNKNERIVALIPVGHYFPTSSTSSSASSSHHQEGKTSSSSQQQQSSDESSFSSSIMQQKQQLHHREHRRRYKRPLHGNLLVDL